MGLVAMHPRAWYRKVCASPAVVGVRYVEGYPKEGGRVGHHGPGCGPFVGFIHWEVCQNPNEGTFVESQLLSSMSMVKLCLMNCCSKSWFALGLSNSPSSQPIWVFQFEKGLNESEDQELLGDPLPLEIFCISDPKAIETRAGDHVDKLQLGIPGS